MALLVGTRNHQVRIAMLRPGATLGDIGAAIQKHAEAKGYSIVREFCGHGIGKRFHEEPQVLHYGRPGQGVELRKRTMRGMTPTRPRASEECICLTTRRCGTEASNSIQS